MSQADQSTWWAAVSVVPNRGTRRSVAMLLGMLLRGATYEDVAADAGCSKQNIHTRLQVAAKLAGISTDQFTAAVRGVVAADAAGRVKRLPVQDHLTGLNPCGGAGFTGYTYVDGEAELEAAGTAFLVAHHAA